MKRTKNKPFFIIAMLFICILGIFSFCHRNQEKAKGVSLENTDSVAKYLVHQMEDLYSKVNGDKVEFDTCQTYRQSNGITIIVATATNDKGEMTCFAAPANDAGTEIHFIGELPSSTCTFKGLHIEDLIPPVYDGEYTWDFYSDKPSVLENPTFRKSITAYRP